MRECRTRFTSGRRRCSASSALLHAWPAMLFLHDPEGSTGVPNSIFKSAAMSVMRQRPRRMFFKWLKKSSAWLLVLSRKVAQTARRRLTSAACHVRHIQSLSK